MIREELYNYRFEQAKKLFLSIQQFKEIEKVYCPRVHKTLKEWFIHYQERVKWTGTYRLVEEPLLVIDDLKNEIEKMIDFRVMEGYRILIDLLKESQEENKHLQALVDRDKEEHRRLQELIEQLESVLKKSNLNSNVDEPSASPEEEEKTKAEDKNDKKPKTQPGNMFLPKKK